ncbi:hypothetical protein RHSIM_Rhsim05G0199000 [Rhododendron simsii]|uniref:Uncharacterized protein n=1 Tax=Rhododendron simsii TaxID=118357 RepID=A0A834H3S8_RHOSS|nr:hypothetical protein RHSIM_Rhsim05G0199000 [Rhododendron simsii]
MKNYGRQRATTARCGRCRSTTTTDGRSSMHVFKIIPPMERHAEAGSSIGTATGLGSMISSPIAPPGRCCLLASFLHRRVLQLRTAAVHGRPPPTVVARSQPCLSRLRRLLWRCRTTRADEGEEVLIVTGEMVDVGSKAEEADGDFDFEEDDGGGKADLSRIIGSAVPEF